MRRVFGTRIVTGARRGLQGWSLEWGKQDDIGQWAWPEVQGLICSKK
jgi:hypothetical protein